MSNSVSKLLKNVQKRITNNASTIEWLKENKIIDFKHDKAVRSRLYLISKKWVELTDIEKEDIGLSIAGKYYLVEFYNFMDNYEYHKTRISHVR